METNTEQGNLFKQRAIHSENFTIIHNEILFIKDENNKLIDLGTLGLFWRILSLPKNWKLNIKGLATICGCTINKVESHLKKLKELGYITECRYKNENGTYNKNYYKISETINTDTWLIDESESEIIDIKNEEINNPLITESIVNTESNPNLNNSNLNNPNFNNSNFNNPNLKNSCDYKVYNNKVSIDKESNNKESKDKKEEKTSFSSGFKFSKKDNINNDTNGTLEEQTCDKGGSFSEENQVISSDENKKSKGKKNKRNNKEKDVNEILKDNMNKTDAENKLAREIHAKNGYKEMVKDMQLKAGVSVGTKKAIMKHIEKTFSENKDIMLALKSFAEMYIARRGALTSDSFDLLIKDLYAITTNPKEMLKIINTSIKKSYLGFFPENQNTPTTFKNNTGKSSKMSNPIPQNSPPLKSDSDSPRIDDKNNLEILFKPSNKMY